MAGFTPQKVGLNGETITSPFKANRPDGCPHRGLDISSSGQPKNFKAGIHGKVTPPLDGPYGTVTIAPMINGSYSNKYSVQYLHCSEINVSEGDVVTPDTILGKTGEKAPPTNPSNGIHLHIQVKEPAAQKEFACWDFQYIDPATFEPS